MIGTVIVGVVIGISLCNILNAFQLWGWAIGLSIAYLVAGWMGVVICAVAVVGFWLVYGIIKFVIHLLDKLPTEFN